MAEDNTPTNVVDDVVRQANVVDNISKQFGAVDYVEFYKTERSAKFPSVGVNVDSNGNIIIFRATDDPNRLINSNFKQISSDGGTAGMGQQSYFATDFLYSKNYSHGDKKLYGFNTNIKPEEILQLNKTLNDYPDLAKALQPSGFIKPEYMDTPIHYLISQQTNITPEFWNKNIPIMKSLGYKAIGTPFTGQPSGSVNYEIIPLIDDGINAEIKPIGEIKYRGVNPETNKMFPMVARESYEVVKLDTPTNVVDDAPKSLQQVYDNLYNKPLNPGGVKANQANSFSKLRPDGTKVVVHFSLVNEILDNYGLEKTQLGAWENEAENVLDIILDTQYKILKDKGIQESPRGFFGGNYTSVSPEEFKQIIPKLNNYFLGKEVLLDSEDYLDESGEGLKLKYKGNPIVPIDTPGSSLGAAKLNDPLVFDSWVDNYAKTTTSFVDNLPLVKPVKDLFLNAADNRIKRLARQAATPGGLLDAVDIYELGVLTLVAGAIAYNEIDEIPKITKNAILRTYNLSQGRPIDAPLRIIGLPEIKISEYDIDFEYAMETLERGEKVMPTDIIIKKVEDVVKGAAETGAVTGFGYVPPNLTKTDTMETTQKIQPGVQEEKMFKKAKPQKGSGAGSGVKIL